VDQRGGAGVDPDGVANVFRVVSGSI
jgi:hypothetical protein